jgi:hypothetical protein
MPEMGGCGLEWWSERGSASRSNARIPGCEWRFEDENENEDEDECLTTGLNHTRWGVDATDSSVLSGHVRSSPCSPSHLVAG